MRIGQKERLFGFRLARNSVSRRDRRERQRVVTRALSEASAAKSRVVVVESAVAAGRVADGRRKNRTLAHTARVLFVRVRARAFARRDRARSVVGSERIRASLRFAS